jgi:hypothetical protein
LLRQHERPDTGKAIEWTTQPWVFFARAKASTLIGRAAPRARVPIKDGPSKPLHNKDQRSPRRNKPRRQLTWFIETDLDFPIFPSGVYGKGCHSVTTPRARIIRRLFGLTVSRAQSFPATPAATRGVSESRASLPRPPTRPGLKFGDANALLLDDRLKLSDLCLQSRDLLVLSVCRSIGVEPGFRCGLLSTLLGLFFGGHFLFRATSASGATDRP